MPGCFYSKQDTVPIGAKTLSRLIWTTSLIISLSLGVLWAQTKLADSTLREVLPDADFFVYQDKPFPYYQGYQGQLKEEPELAGLAFSTEQLLPEEKGYNGPINILVGMGLSGELVGMKILEEHETPSYTGKIYSRQFQRQFIGKSVFEPIRTGQDIDAITRATISSEAVARSVRRSMRLAASELLRFENLPQEPGILDEFKRPQIYLVLLLLISGLGVFLSKREDLRWALLAVSFGYLGFITGNFLSIVNFVHLANLRLPPLLGNLYWYIFLAFVLVITLLWGRLYCGYLCPFGIICAALQKLPVQRLKVAFSLNRKATYLKLWILAVLLVIYLWTKNEGLFNYEIFVTLFILRNSFMAWLLLIVSILAMLSCVSYFWCRFLCPAGGLLGIISRFSLFKQRLSCPDPKCRLCVLACPMGCIDPDTKTIFFPECIRCNLCINRCPNKNEER